MTWEEIIIQIRKQPEYKELVEQAYFEEDLSLNVERFKSSEEFAETLKHVRMYCKAANAKLLDLGAGNGVASLAFALNGFSVSAVDPDTSATVGTNAIRKLKSHYNIPSLEVIDGKGENLPFPNENFDVVYIRQAMHHAAKLLEFVKEASRVLKKGGIFFTTRDHVIYDEKDKQWFLETHPLHKFYGGENAFTLKQYKSAIEKAGLKIIAVFRHFDSVINYFPNTLSEFDKFTENRNQWVKSSLHNKLPGFVANIPVVERLYSVYVDFRLGKARDEKNIPGRLISFIAIK